MAKTTITQITDDLDGSKDAVSVSFAFDGAEYEIDLSKKNRAALAKALQPYIDAGAKVSRAKRTRSTSSSKSSRRDLADVRVWAKQKGLEVSDRGRVAANVLAEYDATH